MPTGIVYERLYSAIYQLSKPYSTPTFEPHVTLIGTLSGAKHDILTKTAHIATMIKPYEIKLMHVDYLNEYFRCLFIRVKQTKEVMSAHEQAQEVFKQMRCSEYLPHLSLMYGDIAPEIKKAIITAIGKDLYLSFGVSEIHLFSTAGAPEAWHKIQSFSLK